eukprot:TRINITY_DN2249_c0_g1_i1.p1 TRINITY_DN2249_c0_g1~~TRINITY_DN2249_c0_g1_i1.p1  ORF type:complete len:400 (+),score=101.08 TRINITY_DN2249_c0_g1_i1:44-1201(+)
MNYELMLALQQQQQQQLAASLIQMPMTMPGMPMMPAPLAPFNNMNSLPFMMYGSGSSGNGSERGSGSSSSDGADSDDAKKVVVFDPINKRPYSLTYGSEGSEIQHTAGLELHLSSKGVNKRAFLCKKYQARQCRAQGKCNSIHADRKKIAQLRAENPTDKSIPVEVSVYNAVEDEVFSVPTERILKTDAYFVHVVKNGKSREPFERIVCVKHETEGCDGSCGEIHIDVAYLRHVRSMWKAPCCSQPACSAATDASPRFPMLQNCREWKHFRVSDGGKGAVWQRSLITYTKGLHDICDNEMDSVLTVPMNRVCRPHQKKACKWGLDCGNVHICRKKMPSGFARPARKPEHVSKETVVPVMQSQMQAPQPDLSNLLLGFRGAFNLGE